MAKIFTPINYDYSQIAENDPIVFLAGTIEMGNSVNWQETAIQHFSEFDNLTIFNPRRVLPPDGQKEIESQINWELTNLAISSFVFFHFAENTISPISLLELGLMHGNSLGKQVIISCHPDYTRRTNVEITIAHPMFKRPNFKLFNDFDLAIEEAKLQISKFNSRSQ